MKYKTASAFRHALEERLRQHSLSGGTPLARLRKMVTFDRFLARLAKKHPDAWIVKGGFALQLRLGERARTTKDVDVLAVKPWTRDQTIANLRAAVTVHLGDWFEFEVGEPAEAATGAPGHGFRFPIRCLVDGRPFEIFHLDVGYGDPVLEAPVELTAPGYVTPEQAQGLGVRNSQTRVHVQLNDLESWSFIKRAAVYPTVYQVTKAVTRLLGADLSARRQHTLETIQTRLLTVNFYLEAIRWPIEFILDHKQKISKIRELIHEPFLLPHAAVSHISGRTSFFSVHREKSSSRWLTTSVGIPIGSCTGT